MFSKIFNHMELHDFKLIEAIFTSSSAACVAVMLVILVAHQIH
jgi:hypothetical protein